MKLMMETEESRAEVYQDIEGYIVLRMVAFDDADPEADAWKWNMTLEEAKQLARALDEATR